VSKKTRRSFTADQKAAIVRRHLVDKVPVSNLCDEYGIQPSMFYNWQKVLVDNAARAFDTERRERGRPSREAELEQRIAQLEAKLAKKDGIIAEISEEYVTLKKELGEP
jgi:transposase-like protein